MHGALGYSTDTPLERMLRHARSARLVDGADEVHLSQIAQNVMAAVREEGTSRRATGLAPRSPTTGVLYEVVRTHLADFRDDDEAQEGRDVPLDVAPGLKRLAVTRGGRGRRTSRR